MKLKKKPKKILKCILVLIIFILIGFLIYKMVLKKDIKEVKIINSIKDYGYNLKENKPKKYKELFNELKEILSTDKVDEEKYVKKLTEMFIYDFYSLDDKVAKTDVGGVEFIHSDIKENFLANAENTYYKYIESNIYNNRKQKLPIVAEITIDSTEQETFEYNDKSDDEAYIVKASWTYSDSDFADYQQEATLVLVHENKKLSLVELQ